MSQLLHSKPSADVQLIYEKASLVALSGCVSVIWVYSAPPLNPQTFYSLLMKYETNPDSSLWRKTSEISLTLKLRLYWWASYRRLFSVIVLLKPMRIRHFVIKEPFTVSIKRHGCWQCRIRAATINPPYGFWSILHQSASKQFRNKSVQAVCRDFEWTCSFLWCVFLGWRWNQSDKDRPASVRSAANTTQQLVWGQEEVKMFSTDTTAAEAMMQTSL